MCMDLSKLCEYWAYMYELVTVMIVLGSQCHHGMLFSQNSCLSRDKSFFWPSTYPSQPPSFIRAWDR